MNGHEWGERYEAAMRQLRPYVRPAEDGTFRLIIEDGRDAGIDPIVFADLKRSLDETNRLILSGNISAKDVHF